MTTTYPTSATAQYAANPLNRWLAKVFPLNWESLLYILILVLAIFTRFYLLGDRTMSHDESLHVKFSWDLYANGIFQHTPLMHGPIIFHMTALNYFLFGDNDFTARIYPAVLGVLMVMFPILFRRWIGRWGALLASLMLLISPLILFYNRYIREDTPSIFFTMIMVYCTFMYLNGPVNVRRKARWLYIFSGAMLCSMASKEVAFMYLAIFFGFLVLYWVARVAEYFLRWHGRTLLYFVAFSVLLGGVAALGMYIILEISPWSAAQTAGFGSIEFDSFFKWTLAVIAGIVTVVVGPLLWAFRRNLSRIPWLDVVLIFLLVAMFASIFIFVEERSRLSHTDDATEASAPVVPGEEGAAVVTSAYNALPFYAEWLAAAVVVVVLLVSVQAGWWRKLRRFPELDIIIVMGTLALPWATPFVMKWMGASVTSMPSIAAAVQAAIPFIQFDLSNYGIQFFLSFLTVLPAFIVAIALGLVWDWKRWLISAAVFHILFLFFFTTVFTNFQGIFTGMIGSLGYWLEQQAVRRGNQPQYYYLVLIMPFYEFLPVIGSILAMVAGMLGFWKYRKFRLIAAAEPVETVDQVEQVDQSEEFDFSSEVMPSQQELSGEDFVRKPKRDPDRLRQLPVILFISWWAVLNLIAYTLAGEKMPWLGTHMTVPMIFLTGWFFGGIIERLDVQKFWSRTWAYLVLLPLLLVAVAQVARPLLFGQVAGGLQQEQLTRSFQWIGGFLIAALVVYAIYQVVKRTGWSELRYMFGVAVFVSLAFLTFRTAWMAAFINYDTAKEFLVYAHAGPANKQVEQMLEDLGRRTTGDSMEIKFAYDYRISWPGAWYFRNFKNAVFLGESPSPRQMEDAAVIIVGNENKAVVESSMEDQYYRFDYVRMWWPMQDYFNLTPQRITNVMDFSPENVQAGQIREGLFDIWWSRDYQRYGEAVGRNFDLNQWPLADRMYVYVRKDLAAQVWNLGIGDGSAANPVDTAQANLCTQNWEPRAANFVMSATDNTGGPLSFPRQIAVGPDGKIYAAEEFKYRVSVFNPDGTFAFSFGEQGAQPGQFERPNGIAVGASGNIYVADTWNYRVQVFNSQGEYLTSWGQKGELGSGAQAQPFDAFWGPRAIAVDANEQVYVADTGNKRVRVYTSDGQYLRDIGSGGSGNGQLDEPSGLAVSLDGLLYVADTWNRRISVFTTDGVPADIFQSSDGLLVNNFRVRGWVDDLGNRPYVAFDANRKLVFVTDPDAGRVLIYDSTGQCVSSFGQLSRETQDNTQFASVGGVAINSAGDVFVADAGSGRILGFAAFEVPVAADSVLVPPVDSFETTPELIAPVGVEITDELTAEITAEQVIPIDEATEELTVEATVEVTPEATEPPAG